MSPTTPEQPRNSVRVSDERADGARAGGDPDARRRVRRSAARSSAGPPGPRRAPLAVAATVAVGWAALVSYLPVALVLGLTRYGGGDMGLAEALRLGLAGWLLGHGVPLRTATGPLGLAPLALTLLAAWRVARAGVHVSRAAVVRHGAGAHGLAVVAGTVGLGYGLLGLLAALLVAAGGPEVSPVRAGITLAGFGTVLATGGAVAHGGELWDQVVRRTPTVVREGIRGGLVAASLLLAAGAGVAGLAVVAGGGEASDMLGAYRTGLPGQAGITLISLGYAPNAAIWATSYLLGPGFAVGAGTVVRTSEVSLGALPAVPLLAGLPHGPVDGPGTALLAVPALVGMAAGWLLLRRLRRAVGVRPGAAARGGRRPAGERPARSSGWGPLLGSALIGGPVAGALVGFVGWISGGPLGGGRLVTIGPVPWQVAAVGAAVLTAGILAGAVASRYLIKP